MHEQANANGVTGPSTASLHVGGVLHCYRCYHHHHCLLQSGAQSTANLRTVHAECLLGGGVVCSGSWVAYIKERAASNLTSAGEHGLGEQQ